MLHGVLRRARLFSLGLGLLGLSLAQTGSAQEWLGKKAKA